MKVLNLGFFSSHGGSNMQAVIDASKSGELKLKPCVVISNNSDSTALERARNEGIPYYHLSSKTHPDEEDLDEAILAVLKRYSVDIIVLVGYMKKLGMKTLKEYRGRVLNIHPALLPKYGGKGMYGKYVHEAVLAAKEQTTGVTIHIVDEEYDRGQIRELKEIKTLNTTILKTRISR
jgi:phosphoribosylglycinamide formyltransferase-1